MKYGVLLVLLLCASLQAETLLYVSPTGNDAWSGTLPDANRAKNDGPCATLEHARDLARQRLPAVIQLRAGTHFLSHTLALSKLDSGLTITAYPGEKVVVAGGKAIAGWVPWKGSILKTDVASQGYAGIQFRELLLNGRRQICARYPNFDPEHPTTGGWAFVDGKIIPMNPDLPGDDKRTLKARSQDIHAWAHPEEMEVFIFPRYNWWNSVTRVKSVDAASNTITLESDAIYAIRPGNRYYVQNALEELDAPGEWYLDPHGTLYFWPPESLDSRSTVVAPMVETLIEGNEVSKLNIKGITLECAGYNGVSLRGCTDSVIAGCTLRSIGTVCKSNSAAINIVGGARCGAVGNDVYDVGSTGISLLGGVIDTLTSCDHYADNNYIHHMGVVYKQGVGVSANGVGCRVSHNLIHDGPRFGIGFNGNKHVIELNHIRHVNLETEDTGAIYVNGRDWLSGRGTVIRYNYIHDVIGYGRRGGTGNFQAPYFTWGIYLDDNASGIDIVGNILVKCVRGGINLHNARDNLISNNVFIDNIEQQIQATGWEVKGRFWTRFSADMAKNWDRVKDQSAWKTMRGMNTDPRKAPLQNGWIISGNVIEKNIFYYSGANSKLYWLTRVPLDHHTSDSNLIWHNELPLQVQTTKTLTWDEWLNSGFDKKSVIADPGFVNARQNDFHLRPDSPAATVGFRPIPIDDIGPFKDPSRATWPIVEAPGAREKPLTVPPEKSAATRKATDDE